MPRTKTPQTVRMTDEALEKLKALSHGIGISQADVVQLAIKDYWEEHGSETMLEEYRATLEQSEAPAAV